MYNLVATLLLEDAAESGLDGTSSLLDLISDVDNALGARSRLSWYRCVSNNDFCEGWVTRVWLTGLTAMTERSLAHLASSMIEEMAVRETVTKSVRGILKLRELPCVNLPAPVAIDRVAFRQSVLVGPRAVKQSISLSVSFNLLYDI
jgi:hypothetical protein